MRCRIIFLSLLLLNAVLAQARPARDLESPAFSNVPEISSAFRLLYIQHFPEARAQFASWESQHPNDPFGEVAVAASYLFEEFYHQGVLSSDFFLNEKRFLHGIDGKPDPDLMRGFDTAIRNARKLATQRLAKSPRDPEALYALTLSAGMESDADMILKKQNLEALKRLK